MYGSCHSRAAAVRQMVTCLLLNMPLELVQSNVSIVFHDCWYWHAVAHVPECVLSQCSDEWFCHSHAVMFLATWWWSCHRCWCCQIGSVCLATFTPRTIVVVVRCARLIRRIVCFSSYLIPYCTSVNATSVAGVNRREKATNDERNNGCVITKDEVFPHPISIFPILFVKFLIRGQLSIRYHAKSSQSAAPACRCRRHRLYTNRTRRLAYTEARHGHSRANSWQYNLSICNRNINRCKNNHKLRSPDLRPDFGRKHSFDALSYELQTRIWYMITRRQLKAWIYKFV